MKNHLTFLLVALNLSLVPTAGLLAQTGTTAAETALTGTTAAETALTGTVPTETEQLAIISRASQQINTLDCRFVMEKTSKLLSEPQVREGRLLYLRPDRLRMNLFNKDDKEKIAFALVSNQGQAYGAMAGSSLQAMNGNLGADLSLKLGTILGLITGELVQENAKFDLSMETTSDLWTVVLRPKERQMKKDLDALRLHFDPTTERVRFIEIAETNGSVSLIRILNEKINGPLDETEFTK